MPRGDTYLFPTNLLQYYNTVYASTYLRMHSGGFGAVAPQATQRAPNAAHASGRRQRVLVCGAAALVLAGCVCLHVVQSPGARVLGEAGLNVVVNGESVLATAGLQGAAGTDAPFPVAKMQLGDRGDSPLLETSPQASHLGGYGTSGSQQGEQPGHWGGVGSENYGTPLWDNTGWNAHYHPRDGASMDSESMEPWYWRKGPRVNDEYTVMKRRRCVYWLAQSHTMPQPPIIIPSRACMAVRACTCQCADCHH